MNLALKRPNGRPLHARIASFLIPLALPITALAHDGEMMEPADHLALSGIGNSKFDAEDFEQQAGFAPRMQKMYIDFDAVTTHPITPAKLLSNLQQIDADGQVSQIGLGFKGYDPVSFFPMDQSISLGMQDSFIDSFATVIRDFGEPVFIVPGYEFNLVGYTPHYFPQAFRHIVDRFRAAGVDNVAWVWNPFVGDTAPSQFDAKNANGEYLWWPGPHYVRWLAANVFQATAWTQGSTDPKAAALNALMDFADSHKKPVMFSEATSMIGASILPTSNPGAAAQADYLWNEHFFHLFDFIERTPRMKGFLYISTQWDSVAWPGWGNCRVQDNAYLMQKYVAKLQGGSYANGSDAPVHPWVPHLIQKAPPGGFVPFQIANLPAGSPAALLISTSLSNPGLPFAGGSVDGLFRLAAPFFFVASVNANAAGTATVPTVLPSLPSLSGQSFESQWISLHGLPTPMRVEIQ